MTVLPRREDEFVVDDPFGVLVEQGRGRMDVHGCTLDERLVAFLRVFLGCVTEEAGADGTSDAVVVFACTQDIVLVPKHQ